MEVRRQVNAKRHPEIAPTVFRPANRIPGSTTDPDSAAAPASSGNHGPDRRGRPPGGGPQKLFGVKGARPTPQGRQNAGHLPPSHTQPARLPAQFSLPTPLHIMP